MTHAIEVLSPYQSALPTRMGRLVARATRHVAQFTNPHYHPETTADMQKAVDTQARLTNLGEKDDLEPFGRFLRACLDHQLATQPFGTLWAR